MTASGPTDIPKKGLPKMLIVIVIVAVVAIAAVAGAVLLMNDTGSNNNDNDNDDDTGDNNNNNDDFDVANGDYMELKTTSESSLMTFNMTMRWEVSNVTSTGYDITIRVSNDMFDFMNYTHTQHANMTDDVGSGAVDDNYTKGTLVGTETLSTAFGNKQVEHWRLTEIDGTTTTITDYYVGKDTKMTYKWVVVVTDSADPESNLTSTTLLTATNIASIKDGNKA
jgi:hypothetical protein